MPPFSLGQMEVGLDTIWDLVPLCPPTFWLGLLFPEDRRGPDPEPYMDSGIELETNLFLEPELALKGTIF